MVRQVILIALCGLAFWAGTEVQKALVDDRCRNAGGITDSGGVCRGVE
jgi:hypothetical protein